MIYADDPAFTGTNLDSYSDKRNIILGLRAGKVLAEWSDVNAAVNVPRFECLYGNTTPECVATFIDKLFVVSLSSFKPDQPLYILLKTCAASLVMYHVQLTAYLRYNIISDTLVEAAKEAKITDVTMNSDVSGENVAPGVILDNWSRIIYEDFCTRNPEIAPPSDDCRTLAATMNQQSTLMHSMNTQLKEMARASRIRDSMFEAQEKRISDLMNQLTLKEQEVINLRSQVAQAKDSMVSMQ